MMKKYRFALLTVFVAMFAIPALRAQSNCYVRLADASGYTPAAEQIAALEQAAAALCLAFDSSGFGGQFKVYDFGFYLHHETTAGGYPEPFARKVEAVAALSPYYLVFGKQSDRSGVYTRFWVEARLPDSLSFSCLDSIGAGILRTSFNLTANIEYEALEKMPHNYHLAEIRVINKLKAEVDKLRECCYNQQQGLSSCDAPCLTPDEAKKLLEQLGFTAIPIKILGPAQARGADGQRPVYDRVTDCAELDIEMDGVEYYDFAGTINNIMSVYQDTTVRAVILNQECLCQGGIEYITVPEKNSKILITIVVWNNPFDPHESTMYTFHKYPDALGVLPFKGHIPNKLGNKETLPLNMDLIKNTVNTIYIKNGFSLTSIDFDELTFFDTFDIVNEIIFNKNDPFNRAGSSNTDFLTYTSTSNFVNYFFTTISHNIKNEDHRNYIIGNHIAHEFFHQIVGRCSLLIIRYCEILPNPDFDIDDGHCRDDRNLMYPGNGLEDLSKSHINWNSTEKKHLKSQSESWKKLYLTGDFYPIKNTSNFSHWERVSPTFKFVVSIAILIREIKLRYGSQSNEFCCIKILAKNEFIKIKYNSYEISK